MITLTVEADVAPDGMLHLALPSGLPPGKVEVVIVVQPLAERNGTSQTNYRWLLDPVYDSIGQTPPVKIKAQDPRTREERARRIMELLDMALKGVTWEQIEEGRQDRCF
jgi:hypothetical protein